MENIQEFALIVFAIIGVVVSIVVTLIALVWLTCFMVRLLVKTFSYRVESSVEVAKEDIDNKAEAKKARNKLKTDTANNQKMTVLRMKLESKKKIYEMRKQKLAETLEHREDIERQKLGLEIPTDTKKVKEKKEDIVVEVDEIDTTAVEKETKKPKEIDTTKDVVEDTVDNKK